MTMQAVRALLVGLGALWLSSAAAMADPVAIARTRAEPVLLESVAYDAEGRLLVSSVHARGVFTVMPDGQLRRWSQRGARHVVFGIAADPPRNALWGAVATPGAPGLVRFDLRTGRRTALFAAPQSAQWFGDLAVGPDGAVYVSDAKAGRVYRLPAGGVTLEQIASVDGGSIQGLAVSPDGERLVFANYGDGLWGLTISTGALARLPQPAGSELRGVDGVTRAGNDLVIVQNGVAPPRVLRLKLDAGWSAVVGLEVMVRGGAMEEPTSGVVREGAFVFVSRSQWTEFGEDLAPRVGAHAPAVISTLPLPSSAPP
ncbi:MAG: hypothetical protein NW200_00515 [Hyphomonadaceae bacterium]|nr:hypothetical protein [Hyphomonadaceae bacterium]